MTAQHYTAMSAGDMLTALGDDAEKWAAAFAELHPAVPQDVMVGWFANAIEHSGDLRRGRLVRDDEAWKAFKEGVERDRQLFRDLQAT